VSLAQYKGGGIGLMSKSERKVEEDSVWMEREMKRFNSKLNIRESGFNS
jgi:hypothetical protein